MPEPIHGSVKSIDLAQRFVVSTAIVGSPALAAETIICQTPALPGDLAFSTGVLLAGWAAYTVGTSGTAVTLRIRQTNVAGTIIVSTGALTGSQHGAAILSADDINGLDTAPAGAQVYVLTMQVTAGAAVSTVSATLLNAIAV
jgi:hypothetical protein